VNEQDSPPLAFVEYQRRSDESLEREIFCQVFHASHVEIQDIAPTAEAILRPGVLVMAEGKGIGAKCWQTVERGPIFGAPILCICCMFELRLPLAATGLSFG
jgi:hypothetical protein